MFERSLKYLVCELVASSGAAGRKVPHVLEHCVEAEAGLARQFVLVEELLQQRLLQRLSAVAPQLVSPTPSRRAQCHLQQSRSDAVIIRKSLSPCLNSLLEAEHHQNAVKVENIICLFYLVYSPLGRRSEVVEGVLLQRVRLLHRLDAVRVCWIEASGVLGHLHGEQRQDVGGWLGEAGQDVHRLGREVAALLGPLAGADTPARVLHRLPRVAVVKDDQVAFGEGEEGRTFACSKQPI